MWKSLISIITIVTATLFSVQYVIPAYRNSKDLQAKLVDLEVVLKDADNAQKLIDETAEVLRGIPEDSATRFSLLVPEELDRLRFSNMLQSMARSRGIILADIKVENISNDAPALRGAPTSDKSTSANLARVFTIDKTTTAPQAGEGGAPQKVEGNYIATNVSFSFGATYPAFLSFLGDIERSIGIINITELSFEPFPVIVDTGKATKGKVEPLYTYRIKAETYSLK